MAGRRGEVALLSLASAAWLCGCGAAATETGNAALQPSSLSIAGTVHGGQQPISGASVYLYQAGAAGPGVGASNLLTTSVVTDNRGGFKISGDFTCPAATTQVYLVAQGGNPGLASGATNPAILQMAALGDCGALNSNSFIQMNEITTVGAVWALQQFMGAGGIVGANPTNATGLRNAFASAANLVNVASGSTPGGTLPNGAVVETAKIVTLADAISVCINSDGGAPCTALFAVSGSGPAPANTLDAALSIVRNPAVHVLDVFNLTSALSPFQPALAAAPIDWTMSVAYQGGGLDLPTALGVDASGNVWVANYFGNAVSEFTTTGSPLAANGFAGPVQDVYGLAIDSASNVWVASRDTPYAVNTADGSLTVFNQAGQVISGSGFTGGGVYYPGSVAADPDGNVWIADYGDSAATLLTPSGSALSTGSGFGGSLTPFPLAIAVDAHHNAWLAVQGGATKIGPDGTVANYRCCGDPSGIAVDPGGNVWLADYYASRLVELSSAGAVLATPTMVGGLQYPQGIAIDSAGSVWATNYHGGSLTELAGYMSATPGAPISESAGFGSASGLVEPFGVALDASGNVWVTSAGTNQLVEIVGAASPIRTPLLGPPQQP
ncbi:NHL repeat-containing protein [Granulicella rosea]|uniref:NHL repeat-containing protein n=1 Tax=Granulicella rosea TaxID=474952 RepID=A0A239H1K6_9BACT|nr:NHL repeat-containing protein [Granulicella rosea]SNS75061.1 NHL repeat-containing protein [Granulicella rosea]